MTIVEDYDAVILNGRVTDPETQFDAVTDAGITGCRIAVITTDAISGEECIDAKGLVVASGFIDTHLPLATAIETAATPSSYLRTSAEFVEKPHRETLLAELLARLRSDLQGNQQQ